MGKRHDAIGIKQAIRFEWMQKAANLVLAGLEIKAIRLELDEYLSDRMGSGVRGDRSAVARSFAVSLLMRIWVTPDPVLHHLHEGLLEYIARGDSQEMLVHWAMISAAYPFWFNVARQTGRVLALQEQITLKQIKSRIVEEYGDRQTVTRNVQFVVRSFAYWGALKESVAVGCYEKATPVKVINDNLAVLLIESILHALPEAKAELGIVLNNPALFPFQVPTMNGDFISQRNDHIGVLRYGLDEEILKLKDE
jgi:hypothetical protein